MSILFPPFFFVHICSNVYFAGRKTLNLHKTFAEFCVYQWNDWYLHSGIHCGYTKLWAFKDSLHRCSRLLHTTLCHIKQTWINSLIWFSHLCITPGWDELIWRSSWSDAGQTQEVQTSGLCHIKNWWLPVNGRHTHTHTVHINTIYQHTLRIRSLIRISGFSGYDGLHQAIPDA